MGNRFKCKSHGAIYNDISLHCILVPVQYREYEYGVVSLCTPLFVYLFHFTLLAEHQTSNLHITESVVSFYPTERVQ